MVAFAPPLAAGEISGGGGGAAAGLLLAGYVVRVFEARMGAEDTRRGRQVCGECRRARLLRTDDEDVRRPDHAERFPPKSATAPAPSTRRN